MISPVQESRLLISTVAKRSLRHSTEKSLPDSGEATQKEEKSILCDGKLQFDETTCGSTTPTEGTAAAAMPLLDEKG
jgi:hypothetical protein